MTSVGVIFRDVARAWHRLRRHAIGMRKQDAMDGIGNTRAENAGRSTWSAQTHGALAVNDAEMRGVAIGADPRCAISRNELCPGIGCP